MGSVRERGGDDAAAAREPPDLGLRSEALWDGLRQRRAREAVLRQDHLLRLHARTRQVSARARVRRGRARVCGGWGGSRSARTHLMTPVRTPKPRAPKP